MKPPIFEKTLSLQCLYNEMSKPLGSCFDMLDCYAPKWTLYLEENTFQPKSEEIEHWVKETEIHYQGNKFKVYKHVT